MTDRTNGKTLDYKLLGTTGERKEVIRSRNIVSSNLSIHKENSPSEAEQASSIRTSTPIHTAGNFDFEDIGDGEEELFASTGVLNLGADLPDLSEEESLALALESLVLSGDESSTITNPSVVSSGREGSTLTESTVILQGEGNLTLIEAITAEKMGDNLAIQEASIAEDIDDYIEENPLEDIGKSVSDLDAVFTTIENLGSVYRNKHKEVVSAVGADQYPAVDEDKFQERVGAIKKYILEAKASRKRLREGEDTVKAEVEQQKKRKLKFLGEEVTRLITDLQTKFTVDLNDKTNEEISRLKNDLIQLPRDLQSVAKTIKDIVEAGETDEGIEAYNKRYTKLLSLKAKYEALVHSAFESREIEKHKTFKKSVLNIKLPEFKGYESPLDIYTFQDKFEKLHLRDTPTENLADLLKNNYLRGSALMMVKDVSDISDIWKRLKDAYGDHQMLLAKKLDEFDKFESLSKLTPAQQSKNKTSGPAKTVELLSKVINLMKDLVGLAERHSIQNHLYYGDGLTRIYRLLGTQCRRKWLELACDIETEKGKWDNLLTFLEKELRVSQQETIIMARSSVFKPKDGSSLSRDPLTTFNNEGVEESHHQGPPPPPSGSKVCLVCGESDHAQTNGPRGSKLVQYVACRVFVEMKPAERFQFLKSKGYCAQCLFPGADKTQDKHKEGRCQRDYVCKHPSHDKFPSKKHVLVCEEHRDSQENKDTLQKFKEKFILRQGHLPDYTKNIQLSHFCYSPPAIINGAELPAIAEEIANQEAQESSPQAVEPDAVVLSSSLSPQAASFVSRESKYVHELRLKVQYTCFKLFK